MERNRFYVIFCLFSVSFFVSAQSIDIAFIQSIEKKADSLISLMSLEEKSSQMLHSSRELFSYGISEYNWWNEALHGVARAGKATVFPQAIALAVHPSLRTAALKLYSPSHLSLSLSLPFSDSTPHALCHDCESER